MSEQLFRVMFNGTLTGEFDEETTKKQFARLFSLDQKRVNSLFSGKEYVIKNNVTEEVAMEFLIRLAEAGCESYIQEVLDENEPDYDEQRKVNERRLRFRRAARPGAIVPDRRLKIRRKRDRRNFLELKQRHRDIPLAFLPYSNEAASE